jgi:hypothetical protein
MRGRLAALRYRSQPRCREWRANDQIVPVIRSTTTAAAMSFVLILSRIAGTVR